MDFKILEPVMKNIFRIFLPSIFMLLPVLAAAQANNNILQLEIATDKRCYVRNEKIKVSIRFINTGSVPLYLYRSDYGISRTDIGAYNPDGKLTGDHSDPVYFSTVQPGSAKDFVRIAPGKGFRQVESFFLVGKGTGTDGEYSLAAFYRSRVGEVSIPALNGKKVWTLGDGRVSSGSVAIQRLSQCPGSN